MKSTADWKADAKQLIRAELRRRDLSYIDLAQRMDAIGLKVIDRTLVNKIATGAFSAVFFLQVMEAIGVRNLPPDTGGLRRFASPPLQFKTRQPFLEGRRVACIYTRVSLLRRSEARVRHGDRLVR